MRPTLTAPGLKKVKIADGESNASARTEQKERINAAKVEVIDKIKKNGS